MRIARHHLGTGYLMQPLPEVRAAVDALASLTGDFDVLRGLEIMSEAAVALVPSVIGVSLTIVVDDEPFTVTATDEATGAVDAVQYLDGGPCLDAASDQDPFVVGDLLDEERWQLYRHAATSIGVRASLSLPLGGAGGQIPGAINLYAAEPHAFTGKESLLSDAFQTPAEYFVRNADLSFMSRAAAQRLPEQMQDRAKVDQATGMLAAMLGWSPDEARTRLRAAADQAGTPVATVADMVLSLTAA